MKITTTTGLVGFLLALSTFNLPVATAKVERSLENSVPSTIEERLSRLTETLRQREDQLQGDPDLIPFPASYEEAGFRNFSNSRHRRHRDDWGNWRNKWRDRGWRDRGWYNRSNWSDWPNRWRDGGGFLNLRL